MNKIKVHYKTSLAYYEISYFLKNHITENTIIICIGTDKCIGDCLGPLVGSMLKDKFFPLPVFGTITEPIHALNLDEKLAEITSRYPNSYVIGIDACLGDPKSIGEIHTRDYPIHPGKGVGKTLPDVGDVSIIGVVDSSDNSELFSNRAIRLNLIMEMSKVIVDGIIHSYYLNKTYERK
ncbi:putative sporulation protein YyaC [Clostridium cavendishii DSM 21758]|uniref:Putative sporulation protein YyaC n=1 Tax=Clostridium cavendishii DSM 21758 TaxID=1121302 RepID=A0A1M6U2N7_9CLOT|nr:spore protease YyaC [Clostridium cavendishii]SHK63420.1 putative sporulation protein YyaC [Clostridium cavendishii DSM 21758]